MQERFLRVILAARSAGKEELVQQGILKAIESFGATRAGVLATMSGRVVVSASAAVIVGLFDSPALSLNRDGYRTTTQRMTGEFDQLKTLIAELRSWRNKGPARAPQMIAADIVKTRSSLTSDVQLLTLYLDGINRQRELPTHGCYQVMSVQHQQLMNAYGRIIALSAVGSDEINPNPVQ